MQITTSELIKLEIDNFTHHKNNSFHSMNEAMVFALGMDNNEKGKWFSDGLTLEQRLERAKLRAGEYERKTVMSMSVDGKQYFLYIYFDRPLENRYMIQEAMDITKRCSPIFNYDECITEIDSKYNDDETRNQLKNTWTVWSNLNQI